MNDTRRREPALTLRENFPSRSVATPFDVPISITEAPITGSPCESITEPSIFCTCAKVGRVASSIRINSQLSLPVFRILLSSFCTIINLLVTLRFFELFDSGCKIMLKIWGDIDYQGVNIDRCGVYTLVKCLIINVIHFYTISKLYRCI